MELSLVLINFLNFVSYLFQEEEICLTVDTTDPDFKPPDEEIEMVPPLEHVIRTK